MSGWLGDLEAFLGAQDARLAQVEEVRKAVLESDGVLDGGTRRAAFEGAPVDEPLAPFVDKVRERAYEVTDEDVTALRRAGRSEDEIFELTIATATGEGFRRLYAGLRAMGELR
jgi:hypothetical protein